MNKRVFLLMVASLWASPLAAQSTDPVIMTAGTITIRQSEFEQALTTLPAEYQEYARGTGKRSFAQDYLRMRLLADAGEKAGLNNDPAVLQQLEVMKQNLVANQHLKKLESTITVTEAELRTLYAATKSEGDKVAASHIMVAYAGSPAAQAGKPQLSDEQAKAKADALHAQIRAGASFEALAKQESDDVETGARGGSVGEFSRGQMTEEFENAAFSTPVGQLAPVTRTQFGYHIIRVDNIVATPFEQVRSELEKSARQQQLQTLLAKMMTDAKPSYSETYFPNN